MDDGPLPRFEAAQRRAFLKGLVVIGAAGVIGSACGGNNDKQAFGSDSTTTSAATTAAPPSSTADSTDSTDTASSSDTGSSGGGPLPDGARLKVDFTYAEEAGGQARNPYIAVWIESSKGELVRNISVWYEQGRGERWLNELSSWYTADQDYYDAHGKLDYQSVSGATRPAGTYSVAWDGKDEAGTRATEGDYVVFIESNREHGSHSITSGKITLGSSGTSAKIPDQGNLSGASATYSV
jgi:hypothetical protein